MKLYLLLSTFVFLNSKAFAGGPMANIGSHGKNSNKPVAKTATVSANCQKRQIMTCPSVLVQFPEHTPEVLAGEGIRAVTCNAQGWISSVQYFNGQQAYQRPDGLWVVQVAGQNLQGTKCTVGPN